MNKFGLVVTAIAAITCSSAAFSATATVKDAKIINLLTTESKFENLHLPYYSGTTQH